MKATCCRTKNVCWLVPTIVALLACGVLAARPAGQSATPLAAQAAGQAPSQPPAAFRDVSLSFEARARDLVSQMTLDEKISQLMNKAPAIPRLGVPAYDWWNECLHGVARAGTATVFPQAIGMAASFDTGLMREVAVAISDEARAKHHEALRRGDYSRYTGLTFWSPNINIFRDPRWGRGQETYGEDPYLTSRMGVEFVKGLQGDDPTYLKVVATAKHFAVHSGPEADRHRFDARPSERDLFETYLPAFRALVREAKVASVMGAYNRVNGESASASDRLLGEILRRDWGFDGYVVSDCGAIDDIFKRHKIVATAEEASALGITRGCDLECGSTYKALKGAVEQGLLREADIDVALNRLFLARFKLGMFDPTERVPFASISYSVNDSPAHDALARRMAQASIVLLKNDAVLPLSRDVATIAVVGPTADDVTALLGNYYGTPSKPVTVLAGIKNAVGSKTRVVYAPGAQLVEGWVPPKNVPDGWTKRPEQQFPGHGGAAHRDPKKLLEEAVKAAKAADLVVFVGGLTGDVEGEEMKESYPGFAAGDRVDIGLPAPQDRLLRALKATGKPVVMVLTTGSSLAVEWAKSNVPAILVAWYPGQEGGSAVADVLFGTANPSGRLPVTFYKSVEQLPPFADYDMKGRTYRYFEGEPLYPFGHGLSYTRFEYTDLRVEPAAGGGYDVSVNVKNIGSRAGHEVVQFYARAEKPGIPMPLRQLWAFDRVRLEPGEQRRVAHHLVPADVVGHYDTSRSGFVVDPGEYAVEAGASSGDIRLSSRFKN